MGRQGGVILAAVDFSQQSINALRQAARQARLRGLRLHVMHIIESQALIGLADAMHLDTSRMHPESSREAGDRLHRLLEEVNASDLNPEIHVAIGKPFEEILRWLGEHPTDLLVLGSRGTHESRRAAGSLAANCIRKAPAEVLIVRGAQVEKFRMVCAFVDFSPESHNIVRQAIYLAQADGAGLTVAHIYMPPWKILHYMSPTRTPTEEEKTYYKSGIIAKLQNTLKPYEDEARGLEARYELIEGSQRIVAIDDFILEQGADLVVINTRGRTGLKMILLRTIAEHIIRTSPCSVLVLKPDEFDYTGE